MSKVLVAFFSASGVTKKLAAKGAKPAAGERFKANTSVEELRQWASKWP